MTINEAKEKLVSVATSELGYREGGSNYTKFAADPKIAQLYGWSPQNQPWCCTFVNWCFLNAFGYDLGSRLTYGGTAACSNSAQLFRSAGAFVSTPEVGDQAFYYSGGGINHTGIVVAVNGSSFTAIEGNYSDKVSKVQHSMSNVAGFGRPNWRLVDGAEMSETPQIETPKTDTENHNWNPSLLQTSNAYKTDCVVLQAILNARHFACGSADGFFGAKTQAAVNRFQRWAFPDDSSEWDGVCGKKTWSALLDITPK